jgi:hypothetical protein
MTPPTFEKAVEQTKAKLAGRFWLVGTWHSGGIKGRIQASKSDHKSFSLLRLDIARALERDREISPPEKEWLIGFLNGSIEEPRPPVGAPKQPATPLMIFDLVSDLVEQGLRATRNDASPPTSACDAVAQAIHEVEVGGRGSGSARANKRFEPGKAPKSYGRVKRIWQAEKRKRRSG